MKKKLIILALLFCCKLHAQKNNSLIFISDTQEPLGVEKLGHKNTKRNALATKILLQNIAQQPAQNVFMLGDIVGLGFKNKFWKTVDTFLVNAKSNHQNVYAVLGNHDVMLNAKKGIENFEKRFAHQAVHHFVVVDSIAVVMMNSNFKKLSKQQNEEQINWFKKTVDSLNAAITIKSIIVCCHHSPFSNSKIVGCNKQVQQNFVTHFNNTAKCKIFLSGHSHNFEHFTFNNKHFFVVGGGGGIHQPLNKKSDLIDISKDYKPLFHYFSLTRNENTIHIISHKLNNNLQTIENGYEYDIAL